MSSHLVELVSTLSLSLTALLTDNVYATCVSHAFARGTVICDRGLVHGQDTRGDQSRKHERHEERVHLICMVKAVSRPRV